MAVRDRGFRAPLPAAAAAKTLSATGGLFAVQRAAGNAAVASAMTQLVQRDVDRAQLLAALRAALAQGDWRQVGTRLNGFSAADILTTTKTFTLGQAAHTRAAVLTAPGTLGQEKEILHGLDQGGSEVTRIGDLYAKYERGVSSANWVETADALTPMTREDAIARLGRLNEQERESVRVAAAGRQSVLDAIAAFSQLPAGTTYAEVRDDLAYIDNFESASYDVFRQELHLVFEDGHEAALPVAQVRGTPPTLDPKVQKLVDELQKSGELTIPTSKGASGNPGTPGFVAALGPEIFFNDPRTGLLRPQNLRPAVAPRLFQAMTDLDPDTQDLMFRAASAFMGGVPMPEGSEWLILLPLFARSGLGVRNALVKAAERRALTKVETEELRALVTSGVGKRPYASSLGELEEVNVMARSAPGGVLAPPKMRAVDWYEGGTRVVTNVPEKFRGKPITVQETHIRGGTWTQLHTVLEAQHATPANVSRATVAKLNAFWESLHNPSLNKPARSAAPIAPDTYARLYLEKPDQLVVHLHLRDAKVTPELTAAAQGALDSYGAKSDLPPVRVVVTGR